MIQEVSKAIEQLLQEQLYPKYITNSDFVTLCIPRHVDQDYLIGIYLYDVEEDGTQRIAYTRIEHGMRIYPDRNMSLHYVIFINEETRFGGYSKELEALLLEALIQTFHDCTTFHVQEHLLTLQFVNLPLEQKIQFWTSLHKPLQPCLFLKISPVPISSRKKESVNLIKDIDVSALQKD